MAKARMLHKKISLSLQVNRLCDKAKLLFTWIIPHTDDDGRLRGEVEYIRATVVPLTKWSLKQVEKYLKEIEEYGLIYRWQQNSEWFIELPKWKEHQYIAPARYKPSSLPPFSAKNDDQKTTNSQLDDNQRVPQSNLIESNEIEGNLIPAIPNEDRGNAISEELLREGDWVDPRKFQPSNEGETAAFEAWLTLDPYNYPAFGDIYLSAYKRGLPPDFFYQFTSDIKQDPDVKKKSAAFKSKVDEYFEKKQSRVGDLGDRS